ncbi:hypothetical protein BC826DRAFT_205943 [Russula brevipes]|nr:hypothetical protein BC826DRAFT_205943 [Russula brevipes]
MVWVRLDDREIENAGIQYQRAYENVQRGGKGGRHGGSVLIRVDDKNKTKKQKVPLLSSAIEHATLRRLRTSAPPNNNESPTRNPQTTLATEMANVTRNKYDFLVCASSMTSIGHDDLIHQKREQGLRRRGVDSVNLIFTRLGHVSGPPYYERHIPAGQGPARLTLPVSKERDSLYRTTCDSSGASGLVLGKGIAC